MAVTRDLGCHSSKKDCTEINWVRIVVEKYLAVTAQGTSIICKHH